MKRSPLTIIVGIVVGVFVVLGVTALIGNREESDETVSAGEWAQNVCGSVGVWRGELESIVEDLRSPSSLVTVGEEPQSETPQGRTGFIRVALEDSVQAAETLVEGVDNSGIPDTPEGPDAAAQVSDWADSAQSDLEDAQDALDDEADSLDRRSSSSRDRRKRSGPCSPAACRRSPTSPRSIPSSALRSAPRARVSRSERMGL